MTMGYNISRRLGCSLAVCGLLLLSACATSTPKSDGIEARAMARWETLLAGDLGGAYEYLSPGFRSSVSSMDYQRSILLKKVRWEGAEYIRSECDDSTCNVMILLSYRVAGALPGVKSYEGKQQIEESWIRIDDVWYLVP